jgi:hypothetical protein
MQTIPYHPHVDTPTFRTYDAVRPAKSAEIVEAGCLRGKPFFEFRQRLGVIFHIPIILHDVGGSVKCIPHFWKSSFHVCGRTLIIAGALCFYVSDIFIARHRFIKEEYLNRLLGLPLYYTGQFILAFSVGFP